MRDRSHHGTTFIARFALAVALSASACVAGEVAEENEAQTRREKLNAPYSLCLVGI
jgi:hypothetical protein